MCGIFASNDPKISDTSLKIINKRLAFRGPDGQSDLKQVGDWRLYHSRLSIIAPTQDYFQPYTSQDGHTIVFNGEILNYKELAKQYCISNDESDTAVLNELLNIENFDLNQLDGFFAFIRIDSNGLMTHCARDKFGVKPLFYFKRNEFITIASEASVLSDLFELGYSKQALSEYKYFRSPIFQESYFQGVNSVGAGVCLISGKYFNALDYIVEEYLDIEDVTEGLSNALHRSINTRLVADVPLGLLYSSGIDSNLLDVGTQKQLTKFTGGFSGDSDYEYAKRLNDKRIFCLETTAEEFKVRFNEMILLRKEPLSVPNEVILSILGEKWSRLGGKVLISGEGADEFFAGYDRIFSWAAMKTKLDALEFLDKYCYHNVSLIDEYIIQATVDYFSNLSHLSPFEQVRCFFIQKHLPVLFRRLDYSLMYSGIEGREPFASFEIFLYAIKLGPSHLLQNNLGKIPLRQIASKSLGADFAFSKKVGFPVNLGLIFSDVATYDQVDNYQIWFEKNMGEIE